MKRLKKQNRPIGLVALLVVLIALLIAGTIAVEKSNHMAIAKKGNKKSDQNIEGNKIYIICRTVGVNSPIMGQSCNTGIPSLKISQREGTEIYIVCETAGINSPIMGQSCNDQLTDSNIDSTGVGTAVPMIIPFDASG